MGVFLYVYFWIRNYFNNRLKNLLFNRVVYTQHLVGMHSIPSLLHAFHSSSHNGHSAWRQQSFYRSAARGLSNYRSLLRCGLCQPFLL